MRIPLRRFLFLSVVTLLAAPLAGCSSPAAPAASPKPHLKTVTYLTDFISNGVYSPMFYGIKKGYYKAQGINLDIKFGTGSSTTVQDIATGKADIGDAFSGVLAEGVANGAKLKAVGFFRANGAFAFFCDKKLGITAFSQLKGHSVIIPPGTVQAALYPGVLKAVGLSKGDIKVDSVAPAAAGSDYAHGQGDCIIETLGDAPTFEGLRPSSTLLWSKGGFAVPGFAFFATDAFLSHNQTLVKGFLKATYQSIAAALVHPSAAVAAFISANPQASPELTRAQWNASRTVFCTTEMAANSSKIGYQLPQAWETIVTEMKKYENLSASIKPAFLYTNEFFGADAVSSKSCTADMAS